MRESVVSIVGAGPTGSLITTLDANGIKDEVANSFYSAVKDFTFPLLVGSVDSFVWTCPGGVWVVKAVNASYTVAGGSGATVTVRVCPQAVAVASGTAQLSAALSLSTTAPATKTGTLISTPTEIQLGDCLAIDMAGTLTGLVGEITISIGRIR